MRETVCFCDHAAERRGLTKSLFYWVTFCTDTKREEIGQNFNIYTVLATIRVGSVTCNHFISNSKIEETHESSSRIPTSSQPSEI